MQPFTDIQKKCKTLAALIVFLASFITLCMGTVSAQNLNWEGPTGVFVTPLAYTAPSPKNNIGRPVVAFHFWDAGEVIGHFETTSVTVGLMGRTEFGYTRSFHQLGDEPGLSPLWKGGFNIVHGKVNLVPENAGKHNWVPAISVGFVARTQDSHVSGMLVTPTRTYNNNDFYLVATKTVTQIKGLPIVLSAGYKATNGVFLGLAGNAPAYKGCAFGVAAFVLKGPAKSTIILGGEFLQQSREVLNLPGADIPTTLVYAMRVIPSEKVKLNLDFGVAQAGGKIMPGVDLKARHTPGFGISYKF
jgi:hypothetical protein